MTPRAELSLTSVSRAGEKWPFSIRLMVLRSIPANSARLAWLRSCFDLRVKSRSANSLRMFCTSRFSDVSLGFETDLEVVFAVAFVAVFVMALIVLISKL